MVTFAEQAGSGYGWVAWVLGALAASVILAFLVAVVIGRGIRLADRRSSVRDYAPSLGVDVDVDVAAPMAPAARARRRVVPVPPIGVALFAVAVALETCGYVVRLTGGSGPAARLLSMDAPLSLPRMFVAALFAAAALAAVAGAGSIPGRRTWWLAVALVAGGIAAVKAGSTVHERALTALDGAVGTTGALAVSAAAALAVVGVLWFLSRTERRDRRRMLGVLALYAGASVGLSAVSSAVSAATGGASTWAAAATFVEESGEALAGVGFLIGVLVGVAPRLVLPASWALRREADAHTLELPEGIGSTAEGTGRG